MNYQGDVNLLQTLENGDICVENGIIEMSGGLTTAVYLSIFGGNVQDDGRDDNALQWWGNFLDTDVECNYRSETQYLLRSIPATPANLSRIEDAVNRDLAWMITTGAARSVDVSATMPGINEIKVKIRIDGDQTLEYVENWRVEL